MKSQKLTLIAAAIGVIAIAAIACGSDVASGPSGDTVPATDTENAIPVEPDGGIGDGAGPIVEDPIIEDQDGTAASPPRPDTGGGTPLDPNPVPDDLVTSPPQLEPGDKPLPDVLCALTLAVPVPIEFYFGSDPIPTGFDNLNGGNCFFPAEIESVMAS